MHFFFTHVVLPVVELLRVNILHSLWVEELLSKRFDLQQIKEGEAMGIGDVLGVFWSFPILQILKIINEGRVLKVAALREP